MESRRRRTYLQACDLLRIANEIAEDNDRDIFDDDDQDDAPEESDHCELEEENLSSEFPVIDDEGDIEACEEESSDSENEDSDSFDSNEEDHETDIVCGDIKYRRNPYSSDTRARNILTEKPRALCSPASEMESFLLFFDEDLIRHILRYTNRKVSDVRHDHKPAPYYMKHFTYDELLACFAIIIRAGVDRDNMSDLQDLWSKIDSRPFYRATIGFQRFKFFLRCVRFDNFRNREERKATDKLAAIRGVWNIFLNNLRRVYVPNSVITVDEQLVGYRGNIPGRTYMPSKPRKYGVKIFWACESTTGFALNGIIYTGKPVDGPPHKNLAFDIVFELVKPFANTGREIVTDRFFTSHMLAKSLLEMKLTLLGTIKSGRKEIPKCLRDVKTRELHSSFSLYDHDNKIVLCSYVPKKNRNVLMLSSSHCETQISQHERKPTIRYLTITFTKEAWI